MKILATICVIGVLMKSTHSQPVQKTLEKVKAGVDTGKEILNFLAKLKDAKRLSSVGEFAEKVAPFLGAVAPAIQLISLLLPKGPTKEMLYWKEQFAEIDAKFDQVFDQFEEVKNLIIEGSLKAQYSQYAIDINTLSKRLGAFFESTEQNADSFKRVFIEKYDKIDSDPTLALIEGMTGGSDVHDNIPSVVMEYTDNHRRRTLEAMAGIINLILKGIKIDLAYCEFTKKEKKIDCDSLQKRYEKHLETVLTSVTDIERKIKDKAFSELSGNIESKLAASSDKSNSEFADELYSFLTDKYDWRDWHVVAYNELLGSDKHWVKWCDGYHSFRKWGRNLVVASVDKYKYPIDAFSAWPTLAYATTTKCRPATWLLQEKCWVLQAKEVFELLPAELTDGCTYASLGVIEANADIALIGYFSRLVIARNNKFRLYAFG